MNPTTLYLDLSSKDDIHHHAALIAEDRRKLAEHPFEYRLDTITILTELGQFDPTLRNRAERMEQIHIFGERLYQKVFSQEMHNILQQRLHNTEWLRLVVRIETNAKRLANVPWEFLYDGDGFLVADKKMSLFHCPAHIALQPLEPLKDDKLRILCLVSSPLDLEEHERLAVEHEQERLLQALDSALGVGQIEIEFEDEASLTNLESALDEGKYHILHYTGHGSFNPRVGGSLIMEDDQGKKLHIGWDKLKFVLKKGLTRGLRLVFLSGCQTAKTTENEGEAFSDLARPLLQAGIPAVIAMQYAITDEAGMILAETFYRSLARGEPIDTALYHARRRLFLHQNYLVRSDFATPVLFSINTDCLRIEERKIQVATPEIKIDKTHQLANLQQLGLGFVGRRRELRQIKQCFLHGNVRAIILHGIGGIGKTVTATQAAYRLQKHFWGVYAFDCSIGILSPDQIVVELHQFLQFNNIDTLQEIVYAPIPPIQKANYLAQVLDQVSLLLIFDNMESLLDKETKRNISDPNLAIFLKTLINATAQNSKFLFISRYTFYLLEDERHEDDKSIITYRLQQAYYAINLGNLSRPESIQIMNRFPSLSTAGFHCKEKIYTKLGGHPYSLNIFAHYCQHRTPEEVLQLLDEVTSEMVYFTMLEMIWNKLGERTRTLLSRISVFQKAIPLMAIEWMMGEEIIMSDVVSMMRELVRQEAEKGDGSFEQMKQFSEEDLDNFLMWMLPRPRHSDPVNTEIEELIHWGLVVQLTDGEENNYSVHSLVREFCQRKLDATNHRCALLDAADFYLNVAKVADKDSPEEIFIKLDARNLLFEAKEFEKAYVIVHEVGEFLIRWGLVSLAEHLFMESIEALEGQKKASALGSLGVVYYLRGEWENALELYRQAYRTYEKLNDRRNMATERHRIGLIYEDRGDYEAALQEYTASLQIGQTLEDKTVIAYTRFQIGNILYIRGDYEAALREYTASLVIAEALGDQAGIACTHHQIGVIHQDRGDYEAALREYMMSLQIAEALEDKAQIVKTRGQIGIIHQDRGDYEAALKEYMMSLQIAEALGDQAEISKLRHGIGNIHYGRGNYEAALKEYMTSLQIAEALGDQSGIAITRGQIGRIYQNRGDYEAALQEYTESLQITETLGYQIEIARARHNIGTIHENRGDYETALQEYTASLQIAERLGDQAGIADVRNAIGRIHEAQGDYEAALQEYTVSLQVKERLGDQAGSALARQRIGNIHYQQGNYEAALSEYRVSLQFVEVLEDQAMVARTYHHIGTIYFKRGEYDVALREYTASLRIVERLGYKEWIARVKAGIAHSYEEQEKYQNAFAGYLQVYAILTQLQSSAVHFVINDLRHLRGKWGAVAFDTAWQEATGEPVPEEMKA